jgi:hypothetical protein
MPKPYKARMDLIPPEIMAVARVFAHGAEKKGDRTWERGRKWGEDIAAALRHVEEFKAGKMIDEGSGESPLAHAIARLLIVHAQACRGVGEDDRRDPGAVIRRRFK